MSTSPASPPRSSPPAKPPLTGLGIACLVLGLLLAVPSGACAGIMVLSSIADMTGTVPVEAAMSVMTMALVVAALPLAAGILLIVVALRLRKQTA